MRLYGDDAARQYGDMSAVRTPLPSIVTDEPMDEPVGDSAMLSDWPIGILSIVRRSRQEGQQ